MSQRLETSIWFLAACREPYRIFFPLGIVMGFVGVGHWLVYGLGWSRSYSAFYHAAIQIWCYLGSFVAGFLMTAVPRFSGAPSARPAEVLALLALVLSAFFLLLNGFFVGAGVCFMTVLAGLTAFFVSRFLKRDGAYDPPPEFVWILAAMIHGITGTAVFLLSQAGILPVTLIETARSMGEQGFILCLVLGVGGFLGPRLLGTHRLPFVPDEGKSFFSKRISRIFLHLSAAALVFSSFWMEGPDENPLAYALRAAVVTLELFWTRALVFGPPPMKTFFSWILWASFWMVAAGYWLTALFGQYHKAMEHVIFIGGFSLMTFSVATMVVLSHSGEGKRLERPIWILKVLAVLVPAALSVRLWAVFSPEFYFRLLASAAAIWMTAAAAWFFFALPFILKVPAPGASEHTRERLMEGTGHAC